MELAGQLDLIGDTSQWEGRTITVAGEWDGVSLHSPAILDESAPQWFTTSARASDERGTPHAWSNEDVRRALDTVPGDGLLVTGEGHDGQGRRVARAVFVHATTEVIAWEESFPGGMIDVLTWLQPHPAAATAE